MVGMPVSFVIGEWLIFQPVPSSALAAAGSGAAASRTNVAIRFARTVARSPSMSMRTPEVTCWVAAKLAWMRRA
jgi:hypothetical protein